MEFESLCWQREITEKNLSIDTAIISESSIRAFRAHSVYNTSLSQLVYAITDMTRFSQWADGIIEARLLEKIAPTHQICYFISRVPFPLKARDAVVQQEIEWCTDPLSVKIQVSAVSDWLPSNPRYIRMQQIYAEWHLVPIGDISVALTYQAHVDPEGYIPEWIINSLLCGGPKNTLRNLHQLNFDQVCA